MTTLDGFLEVPDIPGPSKRDGHEEHIEVFGVEFKMAAPYDSNTQSRRGRVAMGPFIIRKHSDKSTPYLAQACFQNKKLDPVKFYARRTIEEESVDYFVIELADARVIGMEFSNSETDKDLIEEEVSFSYTKIKFVYDDNEEAELDVQTAL